MLHFDCPKDKLPYSPFLNIMSYSVDYQVAHEIRETIEDAVQYLCDENMVSGELMWIIVQTVAEAHLQEFAKANNQ